MTPRVLQLVLSLSPGGTERLVIELSQRLHRDHGMAVCCLDDPGAWATELESMGIPVVSVGREPGFSPQLGRRIADVARSLDASVLHCHHYSPYIYGVLSTLWRPLRIVFTEHGRSHDGPPSTKRRLANQLFARVPAQVCAVSQDLRGHMIAEGFSARRVRVVYNGIRIDGVADGSARAHARAMLGVSADDLVIGAVGRIDPVKDLATLVDAFARVSTAVPRARLALIGDGPERTAVEQRIREAGLGGRVVLTGYRRDVRDLLPALDVYVNTSVFEGVSLTILEAMAAGLPVVATAVGGTPEVVVEGTTGVLVPARDSGQISAGLSRLLHDPGMRAAMGRAGRLRVEERFSIDRMVREYAAAYQGIEVEQCVA